MTILLTEEQLNTYEEEFSIHAAETGMDREYREMDHEDVAEYISTKLGTDDWTVNF